MEKIRNIVYGIEKWDAQRGQWIPHRFEINSLEEVGEVIDLLETALPNVEFRPAQYTIKEFQYIRSFG